MASTSTAAFRPLETARLRLRRPGIDDLPAMYALASTRAATRYMAWPAHRTIADTRDFLKATNHEWLQWGVGSLLITAPDGTFMGTTGLSFETATRAETGYILREEFWGHGFASEALRAVAALAEQRGVRRLYAHCHIDNHASVRVLEHGGFEREGILRKFIVFPNLADPAPQDVYCYARTR